jgi:hypothetical protein
MAGARCCMYGPNYVKLSRVFAAQLFSVITEHYAALRPRSDPTPIGPTAMPRLHSPRPHPYTAIPTARDSNLDSGNHHDMSRLSTLAYLNDAPIHGLTDIPLRRYFQRILGVAPSTLALDKTRQHTLLATQTSTVVTTTCLDYLHSHT